MSDKPTNPKDMISNDKLPFHLWPETATVYASLAMLDGALKYGRSNWRHAGARASVYYDAARRHLNKWFEGEELDESGAPHLGHALACIAILVDSAEAGKLVDDRMYHGGYAGLMNRVEETVKAIRARHADKNPVHYSRLCHAVESPKDVLVVCSQCEKHYKYRKHETLFSFFGKAQRICTYECFVNAASARRNSLKVDLPHTEYVRAEFTFDRMGAPEYVDP
jgi:hypothetical protein